MIDPQVEQLRAASRGSCRVGDKTDKGRPYSLDTFRFTSADADIIDTIARVYGGTPQEWDHDTEPFSVVTETAQIEVEVPAQVFDPWLEVYSAGGLKVRCTGSRQFSTEWPPKEIGPCPNENDSHRNCSLGCKPGVRFGVFLADTDIAGTFTVRSSGWGTLNSVRWYFNLARGLHEQGTRTPGILELRKTKRRHEGQTTRFPVVYLHADMQGTTWADLREQQSQTLHSSGRPVLSNNRPPLVSAGAPRAAEKAVPLGAPAKAPTATEEQPPPGPEPTPPSAPPAPSGSRLVSLANLAAHLRTPPENDDTMPILETKLRTAFRLAEAAQLPRWTPHGDQDALHRALEGIGARHVSDLKKAELLGFTQSAYKALTELVGEPL